jgi:hypothetical protein
MPQAREPTPDALGDHRLFGSEVGKEGLAALGDRSPLAILL